MLQAMQSPADLIPVRSIPLIKAFFLSLQAVHKHLLLCVDNSTPTSLNNMLRVAGGDNGQTLTWTIITNPSHGTLNGFPATATISGAETTPSGLSYVAANGYTGTDAFTIQVSDGMVTATASVTVTVNALPIVTITATQGTILCGTGATCRSQQVVVHL
jgi:hypothetical protein